jgi:hypothetical protein
MTATCNTLEGNQRRTTYTFGTSRKVAGSIPDGVIGIFFDNPFGRTIAPGVD